MSEKFLSSDFNSDERESIQQPEPAVEELRAFLSIDRTKLHRLHDTSFATTLVGLYLRAILNKRAGKGDPYPIFHATLASGKPIVSLGDINGCITLIENDHLGRTVRIATITSGKDLPVSRNIEEEPPFIDPNLIYAIEFTGIDRGYPSQYNPILSPNEPEIQQEYVRILQQTVTVLLDNLQ